MKMGMREMLQDGICEHYDNLKKSDWDVMYQIFVKDERLVVLPLNIVHDIIIRANFYADIELVERTKLSFELTHDELLEKIDLPKKNIQDYCIVMYVTPFESNDVFYMLYKRVMIDET